MTVCGLASGEICDTTAIRGSLGRRGVDDSCASISSKINNEDPPRSEQSVDQQVAAYVEAIPPEHRDLFDRIRRLILDACPDAAVALSYKMPTYQAGNRRLHLGVWKHGVSLYGWKRHGDGGFTSRHPELQTSTGTIQLRSEDAERFSDDEIRDLARAVLGEPAA